jgi:NADPH:quinone reductase-like Zn-dependent oxidoreductase
MKAIVYYEYGSPAVLKIEDIEKPSPLDNKVLIKVRAACVNPLDWHFMRGTPFPVRIMLGLRKPKDRRLGVDVAGQVQAIGANVTQFKLGDEVFGSCRGAFAEFACATEMQLVIKPANITFEQAASVPVAAFTALQALRDKGQIQPGQKVLINGAAGGVGTFAVQIGKSFGANVTGVCSTSNVDLVRSIGADQVIDYTRDDFTKADERYHLFLDCIGNHPLLACARVLISNGKYVPVGGPSGRWIRPLDRSIQGLLLSPFVSQSLDGILAKPNQQDLIILQQLMQDGKVTPIIDRSYKLSEVPEAIGYLEQGHARGKVVITVED